MRQRARTAKEPTTPLDSTALFDLLSDRTRRRLLTLLVEESQICVCRLAEAIDESQPKVSRHLALLREAGVLARQRQANMILYRVHPEMVTWAFRVIAMMAEGAKTEAPYAIDRERLARAKLRGKPGIP